MAKRTGLGRGLSNLLPGADKGGGKVEIIAHPEYQEIAVDDIAPGPNQPRKKLSQKEIEELSKTLLTVGLIEPLIVRKVAQGYELISGERRWRACKMAGYKKVPVIVKKVSDVQALEIAIIENIQREDLNPVEEARAYQTLMEKANLKPAQIADKVGKDRTTIANLLRLIKLPPEILMHVEEKKITMGQARPLLGIGNRKLMGHLAEKIIQENWTARRVEEEVAHLLEGQRAARPKKRPQDANVMHFERRIRTRLLAKTHLTHKKDGSGKLTIFYANLEELERIIQVMGVK